MTYSTSGSVSKLAGCLENELRSMGYDPNHAHDWTILSTIELRDEGANRRKTPNEVIDRHPKILKLVGNE